MESKRSMRTDLLFIFKRLYERNKITKEEYTKAVDTVIQMLG